VDRLLGRGSMGAVLLAHDPAIDRVVAIKLVQTADHLSAAQRDKYRERFYREASAAGQLLHPGIATIFDVGHTDDGTPFLVMEYVKGETLRELLENGKPSLEQTFQIARDVLEALSFAHVQGIVHRDVKPSNIMVTVEGRAKIMDFGIAHVVGSELTSGGDLFGSPYYMAPEQLAKGPITARTDLFALAVVLYRMLTGVLPFTGDSFAAVAHSILYERPLPPERLDPRIGKGLSDLVLRGLEKSPSKRAGSASEILRALTALQTGKIEPRPLLSGRRRAIGLSFAFLLAVLLALRSQAPPPSAAPIEAPSPTATSVSADAVLNDRDVSGSHPTREVLARQSAAQPAPAKPPAVIQKPKEPSRREAATPPAPSKPEPAPSRTEADLFYEARLALERGDLERSRVALETLLSLDPTFAGASELLVTVSDQLWERHLPMLIRARHNHRLGGCKGELSLASLGVRFLSTDHDWAFRPADIRVLERPDGKTVVVETFEKDALSLGKNKRYRFDLEVPISDADWARYQRLLR
jgi:serine/threonine protein kinase